ncbi:uncharacterized protein LOC131657690 [Vicia villosa]|uniref:uncharacterized protein LOC131657690 n=1 Tax=Vicia villosa TaxID=3911 RepID=UPI00273CEF17|nr:uncharacterized protein LOC131657690 [Vicia villosa]
MTIMMIAESDDWREMRRVRLKHEFREIEEVKDEDSRANHSEFVTALSPLDGRYREKVKDLAPIMGEYGLNYYRVIFEIKWLMKLSEISEISEVPPFSEDAKYFLQGLIDDFGEAYVNEIKRFEKITNHDVKAVEYFLKQKCQSNAEIPKVLEFFHFACTSEDINNLAHALILKEAMNSVIFPAMDKIIKALCTMAKNAHISMLSRTHGQPASLTTLGKEMAIFVVRLSRERKELSQVAILGKFLREQIKPDTSSDSSQFDIREEDQNYNYYH